MHSFLLSGGQAAERQQAAYEIAANFLKIKPENITHRLDLKIVAAEGKLSMGIETSREIKEFLKIKPLTAPAKVVVILEAQLLTVEAQNSLLKTLEEPPAHSFIIITAAHEKLLLETVVSRCLLKRLRSPETEDRWSDKASRQIRTLLRGSYGQRLDFFEENDKVFFQKEEVLKSLDAWLISIESGLRRDSKPKDALKITIDAFLNLKKELLESRAGPRNLLELCFLTLPEKINLT